MARGRMISKTLGTSRKFRELQNVAGKLGEFAQSLYPLIVASADDFGRESGDAFTVKHAVFPTSPRSEEQFEEALRAMQQARLIIRYVEANSGIFIQIVDFEAHQQGLHKRSHSRFPAPPETSGNFPEIPSEPNLREPNRREEKKECLRARDSVGDFELWWKTYPKRVGKQLALTEWEKLAPTIGEAAVLMAAVDLAKATDSWRKDGGKYVPDPCRWLKHRRWTDELGGGNGRSGQRGSTQPTALGASGTAAAGVDRWEAERQRIEAQRAERTTRAAAG